MRFILFVLMFFSTVARADLVLSTTTETGSVGEYWLIAMQAFTKTVVPANNDTELMVVMYLYKDKAAYDAGNTHMDKLQFIWDEAARSSFSSTDLSDDGTLFLTKAYDKIKTLSAVPYLETTLDFTTATEPQ